MAGVRARLIDDSPISELKGLPEDISVVTKLEFEMWAEDAHSMSWFGKEEIAELFKWLREDQPKMSWDWGFDYLFGNPWDWWGKFDADIRYPSSVEDIRFVFWFDN